MRCSRFRFMKKFLQFCEMIYQAAGYVDPCRRNKTDMDRDRNITLHDAVNKFLIAAGDCFESFVNGMHDYHGRHVGSLFCAMSVLSVYAHAVMCAGRSAEWCIM